MPPKLSLVAKSLCTAYGWRPVEDLTDTVSHQAKPVVRVESEHGPAVLRVGDDQKAIDAYRRFSSSGITPAVYASGADGQVLWLLVEWLDGTAVSAIPGENPFALIRDTTIEVLTLLRKLHTKQAPRSAQAEVVAEFTRRDWHMAARMGVPDTPPLAEIARQLWEPAVALHGDMLPTNVIRQHDGTLRLIDPAGGFGPPEADAGWWVATRCANLRYTAGSLPKLLELAAAEVEVVLDDAPWLDRRRLHSWTASALCEFAIQSQNHGTPPEEYRVLLVMADAIERSGRGLRGRNAKVGPNDPCTCGSGKKFKRCCNNPATRTAH